MSQASQNLHHLISDDHVGQGVLSYLMVFFAIWWAWMNFTWFASAFDTDDWLYRVLTILQMAGVLVLAAGVHAAMVDFDFLIVTWGYVIMRLAMVAQWLRAAASDPESRATALRFAIGIAVVQVLWLARIYLLDESVAVLDASSCWSRPNSPCRSGPKPPAHRWHPHHIAERFGLFTLLLLGESLLASANAIDRRARRGRARSRAAGARRVRTRRDARACGGSTSPASSTAGSAALRVGLHVRLPALRDLRVGRSRLGGRRSARSTRSPGTAEVSHGSRGSR